MDCRSAGDLAKKADGSINPSRIQIQPNPAKAGQRKSKKKACFSLDFLCRIEPFQWVALTPWPQVTAKLG
jgi:hypothetical protein